VPAVDEKGGDPDGGRFLGSRAIDYRGERFVVGRTDREYAIWDATGGGPIRTFPLTDAGWAGAWTTYRGLEEAPPAPRGPGLDVGPMDVGRIFAGAFRVYGSNLRTLVAVVAVIVVPFQLAAYLLVVATARQAEVSTAVGRVPFLVAPDWVGWVSNAVNAFIVTPLLTAAVVATAVRAYVGKRTGVGQAMRIGAPRAPAVLWFSVLVALGVSLVALPFVLVGLSIQDTNRPAGIAVILLGAMPAIYLSIRWLLGTTALMVERRGGPAAMGRSWRLVRGRWWRTLGILLLGVLILFGVGLVVGVIFVAVVLRAGLTALTLGILSGLGALVSIFAMPFLALLVIHLYLDARARDEGLDRSALGRDVERLAR
jgi:hypothetical protein